MDKNTNLSRKVGDVIERVGQKISDAGAPAAGTKVYNTGDKIEHSQDHTKDVGGNVVDRK